MRTSPSRLIVMAIAIATTAATPNWAKADLIYLFGSVKGAANTQVIGNPTATATYPGNPLAPTIPVSFSYSLTSPDGLATTTQTFSVSKAGDVTTINVHHEETLAAPSPPGSEPNNVFENFEITIAVDQLTLFNISNTWQGTDSAFGGIGANNTVIGQSTEYPGGFYTTLFNDSSLLSHSGTLQPLYITSSSIDGFVYGFNGTFGTADPIDSAYSWGDYTITLTPAPPAPAPEPASILLLGLGAVGTMCGAASKKRTKQSHPQERLS